MLHVPKAASMQVVEYSNQTFGAQFARYEVRATPVKGGPAYSFPSVVSPPGVPKSDVTLTSNLPRYSGANAVGIGCCSNFKVSTKETAVQPVTGLCRG
jgi:hypothetical protein